MTIKSLGKLSSKKASAFSNSACLLTYDKTTRIINMKDNLPQINRKFIKLKLALIICLLISTIGCVPIIEKTYKAPQTEGVLLQLSSNNELDFSPVSSAKIYYREYPETIVNPDVQGQFLLPAVTQIEAKLLMPGHALINHAVIIELQDFRYTFFATGTLNSRRLEEVKLEPIIVPTLQNMNVDDIAWKTKQIWPCDIALIQSLELAVDLAEQLNREFPDVTLENNTVKLNIRSQLSEATKLLHETQQSCRWKKEHFTEREGQLSQTRQYFSEIEQRLNEVDNENLYGH